jgi:hypothetical protein
LGYPKNNIKIISGLNINVIDNELSQYKDIKEVSIINGFRNDNIHIYNYLFNKNYKISIINLEPLNINCRLSLICKNFNFLHIDKVYDYSLSNIKILNQNDIDINKIEFLPYFISFDETYFLSEIYKNTIKEYDFGILAYLQKIIPRRQKIIDFSDFKGL